MNKSQIDQMLGMVRIFGGESGFNTLGIRSFTFPSMLMAARFVDTLKLTGIAWIEDDSTGKAPSRFNEPVTIQVDTKL